MLVSILLVHIAANRLGLRIHYGTLAMCALLSFAAYFGAIFLSPAPDKFYFLRLGGIIFAASLITTAMNWFLVRREQEAAEKFSKQVQDAYDEKILEDVETSDEEEISTDPEPEPEQEIKLELTEETPPPEKIESEPILKPEPTEKVEPKPEPKPEPAEKVEPKPIPKPEPTEKVEPKPAAKFEPSALEKIETLDEILDYAYSEKQQGHLWQAISAYKKALEKYSGDEYAPFVAIDLGNIYKEQAFYTKAIKTYEDAMDLPAVRRNASTRAEFQKNLVYLKTVQSVLLRHRALSTPFSKISRAYLQEIETEFQATQLKLKN